MKVQKTYKGLTAKQIIARRDGETNGGDNMSGPIIWNYRSGYNPDGTLQSFGNVTVCDAHRADCITIEEPGVGPVVRINM